MNTTRKHRRPRAGWTCNEFGVYEPSFREAERATLCLIRQIEGVEKLRRAAYRRLARTVGISWLECRHASRRVE